MAVVGAVLAGGRSLRMGADKARLCVGGRPLIGWAIAALRTVVPRVYCVGGDRLLAASLSVPYVPDLVAGAGPLGGIHSALQALSSDVLVIGCDMPLVQPEMLDLIIAGDDSADAVVPVNGGEYEPLLALYRQSCVPAIEGSLAGGRRRVASFFSDVRLHRLSEQTWRPIDPEGRSFRNVNTPQDLDAVRCFIPEGASWAPLATTAST
ncbi:MAG: molybdenum cofactor guanylyltransferase [Anaerolineae bacterium]